MNGYIQWRCYRVLTDWSYVFLHPPINKLAAWQNRSKSYSSNSHHPKLCCFPSINLFASYDLFQLFLCFKPVYWYLSKKAQKAKLLNSLIWTKIHEMCTIHDFWLVTQMVYLQWLWSVASRQTVIIITEMWGWIYKATVIKAMGTVTMWDISLCNAS